MHKLLSKLLDFVLRTQTKFYHLKYRDHSNMVFANSTTKVSMNAACSMKLACVTEENKKKVNQRAKELVKKYMKTPEKLLDFVQQHGTKVYKTQCADKLLWFLGEEEGFITPTKGFKAFVLNLFIGFVIDKKLKISFTTDAMFLLRDLQLDVYVMSHQFHKWYGYKMKLPGYDYNSQKKFKKIYRTLNDEEIAKMSIEDVISVKEAIARNVESIEFVVNLAKEYDGSKKSLEKILSQKGARV